MGQRELNMQQKRWLDLLKDYDYTIEYHPEKANKVVDALSRKSKSDDLYRNCRVCRPKKCES